MAVLTDNKEVLEKASGLLQFPAAVDIIYKGAIVKTNAAGYLAPMAAEVGAIAAGVAYEKCDNSGGSAGDVKCKVLRQGVFLFVGVGLVQADLGKPAYASDDQTVSITQATNEVAVGKIVEVISATACYVDINV